MNNCEKENAMYDSSPYEPDNSKTQTTYDTDSSASDY